MTPWSDEDDAKLREMIADRKSAAQAACALVRTRNACIGRALRLGLRFNSKTIQNNWAHDPDLIDACGPEARLRRGRRQTPKLPVIETPAEEPAATGSPDGCKWIHGDVQAGGWTYCGHDVRLGTAWCPHHFARVYQAGSALKSHQRASENDAKRRQWLRGAA